MDKNRSSPKPKVKAYLTRNLPIATHRQLKLLAAEKEISLEAAVNYALRIGIYALKKIDVDKEGIANGESV